MTAILLFPDYQLLQKLKFISAHHQYLHWPSRRPAICPHCHKFFKFKYNMKIHMKKCPAAPGHMTPSGPDDLGAQHPSSLLPPPPHAHPQAHAHGAHPTSWRDDVRRNAVAVAAAAASYDPRAYYFSAHVPNRKVFPPPAFETPPPNGASSLPALIPVSFDSTAAAFRCATSPIALTDRELILAANRRLATAGERKWFPGWGNSAPLNDSSSVRIL